MMHDYQYIDLVTVFTTGPVHTDQAEYEVSVAPKMIAIDEEYGYTVVVVDCPPATAYHDAPESRGFHDPEDADAGGCSWITPQGSY